ncbi:aldehyde dehydrogenase family protein [Streptomyces sp. UG1]|uniref:aldehyde dehydrogenase family protein n=1 Tax=Streptomyces sp. UG1 TaxID=3417652 RepID=UPI003CF1009A
MTSVVNSPVASFLESGSKQLWIDGAWRPAADGAVIESINPSTGEVLCSFAAGGAADVDAAVAAARRAFEGPWSRFTPVQRQNVLLAFADLVDEHADELTHLDVLDMGAPIGRPVSSFTPAEVLRYYAGWATKIHGETISNSVSPDIFTYTRREPVGVVGSIIPWNGPLGSAIFKIAPVLATGCTMVLKPAEDASLSSVRLMELFAELNVPAGVVNLVTGVGSAAGAALVEHPGVDKVAFTGSTAVGQQIVRAAAGNLKRLSLELGGKSPDIVFADADLERAVPGAGMGVFANTGQVCCAGTRIFVERPIYEEFVEGLAHFADSLKVGNSLDAQTQIGPIVSQRQLNRVSGYVTSGLEEGARAVTGGRRIETDGLASGYFLRPAVFADVKDEMRIAREEIFGPVASVMPFDTVEEALARSNATTYGLGGGVWTNDLGRAHRVAHGLRTGVVWVNGYGYFDPAVPFGGHKQSGWGSELSVHSLEEYLNTKAVWVTT